jgi:hypothetical protein
MFIPERRAFMSSSNVGFKPYPGARSEPWFDQYAREARKGVRKSTPGAELELWITDDSFDAVVAFYRTLGTEQSGFARSIARTQQGRIGRSVQMTHVLFDDAASPVASKNYVSIQRPVVVQFEPLDLHDVTAIGLYRWTKRGRE